MYNKNFPRFSLGPAPVLCQSSRIMSIVSMSPRIISLVSMQLRIMQSPQYQYLICRTVIFNSTSYVEHIFHNLKKNRSGWSNMINDSIWVFGLNILQRILQKGASQLLFRQRHGGLAGSLGKRFRHRRILSSSSSPWGTSSSSSSSPCGSSSPSSSFPSSS